MTPFSLMTVALVSPLWLGAAPGREPPRAVSAAAGAQRELVRRTVRVTDETREVELHVSAGNPTTLVFPQAVKSHILPDSKRSFPREDQVSRGRTFVLLPSRDLAAAEAVTLQITLADGTLLPPFLLTSSPAAADLFVDVEVALQQKASADSPEALQVQLSELRARLDDCQQTAGDQGVTKVAELVLKQDFRKPEAFVVERFAERVLDRQARLLVETRLVYRLFDVSYLVLTVENRDPGKLWVLERAEVRVEGGGGSADAQVLAVSQDMREGITPGEEAKLVVAFRSPERTRDQSLVLGLFEKGGNRHVTLRGLRP